MNYSFYDDKGPLLDDFQHIESESPQVTGIKINNVAWIGFTIVLMSHIIKKVICGEYIFTFSAGRWNFLKKIHDI